MVDELKRTVLLESGNLQVDYFQQIGDIRNEMLAFSFTERGAAYLDGLGYAGRFLLGLGFDVVAFKSTSFDWYSRVTDSRIREVEAGITRSGVRYNVRVGYGSSMGAYAAVRFSRALSLNRVLAISPLFDIRFSWDSRYQSDIGQIGAAPMMCELHVASECTYYFVYDPTSVDARHIDQYQRVIPGDNIVLTKTRYSGHPSGYFMKEVGILRDFAAGVLLYGRRLSYESIKFDRNRSGWYLHTLALACRRRHKLSWALSICSRAAKAHPHNAAVFSTLADILLSVGRNDAAEEAAARAVALDPLNPHRKLGLAYVLQAAGKFESALGLLEEAIPFVPESDMWRRIQRECLVRLNGCSALPS